MAAMPALGLLMRTGLELRHILVQVEKLPEGTLTAVRSSISGPVRRPIFVFPRKGNMAECLVITMDLSVHFLVRFLGNYDSGGVVNVENRERRRWRLRPVWERSRRWP